jgi:aminoglycoside phosphotransferase (APT) family kinase protein
VTMEAVLPQYLDGASVLGLERLHGGMETDVYRFDAGGRPLVLRLYSCGDFGGRAATEALVLRHLHALGYPVPAVIAFEPDPAPLGAPFLIMERIDGQVLWRHFQDRTREIGPVLISLLLRLHAIDGHTVATILPSTFSLDALAQIAEAGGMADAFEPLLSALRRWETAVAMWPPVLIHGDYHPENVLMTPDGRPAVIDWSGATLADPRIDVANTMLLSTINGDAEGARAFLAGYEAAGGRPLPDMDYFQCLCLARRMIIFLVTMVKGPAIVGLKPGIEVELRRQAPAWTPFVRLLEAQSGVALPGVHARLP